MTEEVYRTVEATQEPSTIHKRERMFGVICNNSAFLDTIVE